jgi:hypothetical protein
MKDNFTEQQREIVARKMGFEGPMQNFGDFLMSSPASASQYSAVANKLGGKAPGFAAGGMPQQSAKMTPDQILEIDAQRNHPEGTSVGNLKALINEDLKKGGAIVQEGNVLIAFRAVSQGVIETHSFNADTPQALLEANKALWRKLKSSGFTTVRTEYQNPKINDLLKTAMNEFDISITENGDTFVMEVRL